MTNMNPFNDDVRFLGGHIPRELMERLALSCLHRGTSKSAALQTAIEEYLIQEDEAGAITEIAKKVYNRLYCTKWKNHISIANDYESIRKEVYPILVKKKIPDRYISLILLDIQKILRKR